ncbi:MAG: hypothetical protein ACD_4C00127G0001 [uncultured bacterium (gcode 4)]|uniref:Uncharacterized protein n=1 Tax=uncultured bacterium (gcode 4) TaxID=1234023 RepID=K2GU68_9BACT|nr:MAG: hypothetical protein ACD_4C00127G0001 [uncultured bacterium (gcode 4)]
MKTKNLKLKIIWAIFVLLSPSFIFWVSARWWDDDNSGRGRGWDDSSSSRSDSDDFENWVKLRWDGSVDDNSTRSRLAENDDDDDSSERWRWRDRDDDNDDDDSSRRNRWSDDDSSNRRWRWPWWQRFLKDKDADKVTRLIDNVSIRNRASFIQRVINRINVLEVAINSSSLSTEEKTRRLAILAEIKDILNEELSNIGDLTDTTPIVISWFSINSLWDTSVTVSVNVNEAWKWYFVILPSGSTAPNASQVKDWKNSSWVTANIKWNRNLVSWTNSFSANWLSPNTSYIMYFTAQDNSWNLQTSVNSLSFTTSSSDVTAPVLLLSISSTWSSWATFSVNSNEAGKMFFVVLPSGSTSPSVSQVKDWRNSSWVTANIKWDRNIISWSNSFNVNWLSPNTSYVIFLVAQDNSWNLQTNVSSLAFTTSAIDVTAPTLSLSLSWTTSSWATFSVNSNEVWVWYFVVLPNGFWTPSAAQIKAWLDSSWTSAAIKWNLNLAVWINLVDLSGLNSLTSYVLYFTAEDSIWNLQQIPISFWLTTK